MLFVKEQKSVDNNNHICYSVNIYDKFRIFFEDLGYLLEYYKTWNLLNKRFIRRFLGTLIRIFVRRLIRRLIRRFLRISWRLGWRFIRILKANNMKSVKKQICSEIDSKIYSEICSKIDSKIYSVIFSEIYLRVFLKVYSEFEETII